MVAKTYDQMKRNIDLTLKCFKDMGFLVNFKKSNLEPSQQLEFLSFLIDTVKFTISLTSQKRTDIHDMCSRIIRHPSKKIKIRYLAKLIGKIIATFPTSEHVPLHYRVLDRFKVKCLIRNKQNWSGSCILPKNCITVVKWWYDNVFTEKMSRSLHSKDIDINLYCDSSGFGWGSYVNGREAKSVFSQA